MMAALRRQSHDAALRRIAGSEATKQGSGDYFKSRPARLPIVIGSPTNGSIGALAMRW